MAQEFAFVKVEEVSEDDVEIEANQQSSSTSDTKNPYKDLECPVCFKMFENKYLMAEHVRNIHNNRRHKCDHCGNLYGYSSHLARHIETVHLSEKKHRCPYCNLFYKRRDELIRHYRNKHSDKEMRQVIDRFTLVDVFPVTAKTYPHKCNKCLRCFKKTVTLKNHKFLCGREEKYACPYCNKKFIIPHRVRKHIRLVHNDTRVANCDICDMTFKKKEKYDMHMKLSLIHI